MTAVLVLKFSIAVCLISICGAHALPCDNVNCTNGSCVNGSCICDASLAGDACLSCSGRLSLTDSSGRIHDGFGNYSANTRCFWLVQTSGWPMPLRLTFNSFATECGWDYLYAFDGTSAFDMPVAALSGVIYGSAPLELTFDSGSAFLYFSSDSAYSMSGFDISYARYDCPRNCSGHGTCVNSSRACTCFDGWAGVACDDLACPLNCSGRGVCVNGSCTCTDANYQGPDCSASVAADLWSRLKTVGMPPSRGRASTSVVVRGADIWLYGGYSLCCRPPTALGGTPTLYSDCPVDGLTDGTLYRFEPSASEWHKIASNGHFEPRARFGHSMVLRKTNEFLVYGGTVQQQAVDELWSYNVIQNVWTRLLVNSSVPLTGHTAHMLTDSVMVIVFGYSPAYGYSNSIYRLTFDVKGGMRLAEQIPAPESAVVRGCYGHSSVLDAATQTLYVYGGYKDAAVTSTGQHVSDELLAFDMATARWSALRAGPVRAFLHTAVLINRTMLAYGGNVRSNVAENQDSLCYLNVLSAYDLDCGVWRTLDSSLLEGSNRFGHVAAALQGTMYILGGFDGRTLNDVLTFKTGNCFAVTDATACIAATQSDGQACVWDSSTRTCTTAISNSSARASSTCVMPRITDMERSEYCATYNSCSLCVGSAYNCSWNSYNCSAQCSGSSQCKTSPGPCDINSECFSRQDCRTCRSNPSCKWTLARGCVGPSGAGKLLVLPTCPASAALTCTSLRACDACTSAGCLWCGGSPGSNNGTCIESNAFLTSFPYGQCLQWTTLPQHCPATTCYGRQTCVQCLNGPQCGWCDDGSGTGAGVCADGTLSGPLLPSDGGALQSTCQKSGGSKSWFYLQCPLCQCNGHSRCSNGSGVCTACDYPTTGAQCNQCLTGYYGNPTNGANCTACSCKDRADNNWCNAATGSCYCSTRGALGDKCSACDVAQKYFGSPDNGVDCYYPLTSEYRYTFNFSKPEEVHYTRLNLRCLPPLNDNDVEVEIQCSKGGYLNFTLEADDYYDPMPLLLSQTACSSDGSKLTYSSKKYTIGPKYNATFVLTVYGFRMPFVFVVSFTQPTSSIDLFVFFVIFFSCFVALLLIVGIAWKLKLRHALRQQQQRARRERQVMAKRAFARLDVELDPPVSAAVETNGGGDNVRELRSLPPRRGSTKIVAIEPLSCQTVGIISALIRLPTGGHQYSQAGQYGMAVGSALVTVLHPRPVTSIPSTRVQYSAHNVIKSTLHLSPAEFSRL